MLWFHCFTTGYIICVGQEWCQDIALLQVLMLNAAQQRKRKRKKSDTFDKGEQWVITGSIWQPCMAQSGPK